MPLTRAQLAAIVAHALPGAQMRGAQPLGERSLLLALEDGRRVVLRTTAEADGWAGEPVAAEATALGMLRGEIDLPLPELLAYEPEGAPIGKPYALLAAIEGEPLSQAIAALNEEQRYAIGRDLGALMTRVHAHMLPAYGALPAGNQPAPPAERKPPRGVPPPADVAHLTLRVERALTAAVDTGELAADQAGQLRAWFQHQVTPTGQRACLVHGDLRPERVILRRRDRVWRIAGLVGWGYAQAWRPGWDHVALLEATPERAYFSLRVGYGNAYDAAIERGYDQIRELALLPYRLALYLEAGRADLALGLMHS